MQQAVLAPPRSDHAQDPQATEGALEGLRLEAARQGLAQAIGRWTAGGAEAQFHRPAQLPSLAMYRMNSPAGPLCGLYEPSLALVVQGAKRVLLGSETFVYDTHHFLVTSLNLPTVTQVLDASADKPFMALAITLDLQDLNRLVLEGHLPPAPACASERAMAIGRVRWPLLRAVQRLVDLLDEPESIPVVAPLVQREILYWLLVSDEGARLRRIGAAGSQSQQISRAIERLRVHFDQPLRIDDLADEVRMSPSTFHRHFKSLTAMSPLQYQKRLRLSEARRLMLAEHLDASTAAFHVGYESASQFSREYSRAFGASPSRDIAQLRQAALGPGTPA